jgi:hypothetical protein
MPPSEKEREHLREWIELSDNLDDYCADSVDYHKRFANPGQAYFRQQVAVHVDAWIGWRQPRKVEGSGEIQLCADFEALPAACKHPFQAPSLRSPNWRQFKWSEQYRVDDLVFVSVGETLEPSRVAAVPSVVRLEPPQCCSMGWIEMGKGSCLFELVGRLRKGESDLLNSVGGNLPKPSPTLQGKLPREEVQGGSEVLDAISNDQAEMFHEVFGEGGDPDLIERGLRIELYSDRYLARLVPRDGIKVGFKVLSMRLRPINLGPATGKVGAVSHELRLRGRPTVSAGRTRRGLHEQLAIATALRYAPVQTGVR